MVTMMKSRWKAEFARALRNFRFNKTESGVFFPAQNVEFGGVFSTSVDGGPWVPNKNTVTLPWLNNLLDLFFNEGTAPTGCYIAPFTNNVAPSSALTAADFASTQGEYTGYTETGRQQWVSNGAAASQQVSNSDAPATFTVGASAVTIRGAGLITVPTKGATTGILVAAALFATPNTLSPGSTLKVQYSLSGAPSA